MTCILVYKNLIVLLQILLIFQSLALNAARGIASLALAYFNYDDIPEEQIHNQDLTYVEEAIEYLLSHPKIKSDYCGMVGNCFGGFLAYHMSLHLSKVKAVFLINTSHNPFWTDLKYKGNIVAQCPKNVKVLYRKDTDGMYVSDEGYNKLLADVTSSQIKVLNETENQYFAVAIGEYDCYQFHVGWLKFAQELSERKRTNFTLKTYPKAGHMIHPPYTPFFSTAFVRLLNLDPEYSKGILIKFGGETRETVCMQEDVWQWMFDFFQKHLGESR